MKLRRSGNHHELYWPRGILRKWLNGSAKGSDHSADAEDDDDSNECDTEELCEWPKESRFKDNKGNEVKMDPNELCEWPKESRFKDNKGNEVKMDPNEALPRLRRQKSETFRAQYITAKEIKIRAGTWNVGGELPPENLDIEDWLDISDPADIYVIGFQEIIPLNAGNMFGAEDNRPIPKWENIIRETLNKIQPTKTKCKCYSDPPSPSRFKPSADAPDIEDEISLETDSDGEEEIYPLNDKTNFDEVSDGPSTGQIVFPNADASFPTSNTNLGNGEASVPLLNSRIPKTQSRTEMMGLSWPEQPLDRPAQYVLERPNSIRSFKSFKASKSFKTFNSFKSSMIGDNRVQPEAASLTKVDLEYLVNRKRRNQYVKIVSKQMVGLFLTIWVRRSLRRHIQNVNVSTVGIGVMCYIGNKGSISVSMSIYQTLFCFICTHLTSGEKEAEAIKRNADVHAIHRRTRFNSFSSIGLPKSIRDHERIIWLGDLNYRLTLSYDKTRQLISEKDWPKLVEYDQLTQELRKGRVFDGWSEGTLNFPPTYKYELNSENYYGEDPKIGRRTPAWCDRILSFGMGMKIISYWRTEVRISDHRPVTASYVVEVEEFHPRRLQKALSYTDAEIEDGEVVMNMGLDGGMNRLRFEEDVSD